MSGDLIKIEGELREVLGKGFARKLRKAGKIPANLMAAGKATSISLNPKLLGKAYAAGGKFELVMGAKSQVVTIKELQLDHVRRVPLHVDLMPVS